MFHRGRGLRGTACAWGLALIGLVAAAQEAPRPLAEAEQECRQALQEFFQRDPSQSQAAIAKAERVLKLERALIDRAKTDPQAQAHLNARRIELDVVLDLLADQHQLDHDFDAEARVRRELLDVRTAFYGAENWRTVSTRLDLDQVEAIRASIQHSADDSKRPRP